MPLFASPTWISRDDPRDEAAPRVESPPFATIYADHFDSVWACARRMGVANESIDDVVQEVFMAAHKQLRSFEGRSSIRSWLLGITVHCVQRHRRTTRRKSPHMLTRDPPTDPETLGSTGGDPQEIALRAEAARVVRGLLEELDDDKRAVFVLAEFERLSGPEIAEALGVPVNTIYSRLRLARQAFAEASARFRAREGRRSSP